MGSRSRAVMSMAANVVDDMVAFARNASKNEIEQALDVLKTGMQSKPGALGSSRLALAEAELRWFKGEWDKVVGLCRQAVTSASEVKLSSPDELTLRAEIELGSCMLGTRALLTSHKDADAFQMAQQCLDVARKSFASVGSENKRWQAMVLSTSMAGLVQHASLELDSAAESFESVMSMLESEKGDRIALDYLIPEAMKQAASFYCAQGRKERAVSLGMRSITAAEKTLEMAQNSVDPVLSPRIAELVVADSKLLMAQSCMYRRSWEEAEEKLGDALTAVESMVQCSGDPKHPSIAIVLLLLAEVYSRTGRVTLAEGLYRELSKMLSLSTDSGSENKGTTLVHPTVISVMAWRFSQLLTALPQRDTEAEKWKQLASDVYEEAPMERLTGPEVMFGSLSKLKGKGEYGRGVVLDLMTRRALPCAKDSDTFAP
eukprot:jgi/Picsp_1/6234/NSC_03588-R1_hypothetical protein CHLNCDRAFT_51750 [Chlorella variabilis]